MMKCAHTPTSIRALAGVLTLLVGAMAVAPSGLAASCTHAAGPGHETPNSGHEVSEPGHGMAVDVLKGDAVSEDAVPDRCDCRAPCCPVPTERAAGEPAGAAPASEGERPGPAFPDGRRAFPTIPHLLPYALAPPSPLQG